MRRKMSDPDTVIELQAKEKKALDNLIEKKKMIDKQIKDTETSIKNYDKILNHMRISEADNLFKTRGISLDDIIAAVESRDFAGLNNKIQITELINKPNNIDDTTDFEKLNDYLKNI